MDRPGSLRGRLIRRLALLFTVILVVFAIALRVLDAKFWGVVVMGGAVIILFFLP